ncbi:endonuclease/exonuclease/phosphatase family protein [Streptomyces gamaensis]|uniref:Endonuclease/exonuclease/phosphatase family protein n=1 Tax=Streptomyces gamaensis TaxID=1763542 RepID=A0ABW0Z303_9ACTN
MTETSQQHTAHPRPDAPAQREWWRRTAAWFSWQRGRVLAVLGFLLTLVIAFPGVVPNTGLNAGSFLESFRPWLGLLVLPLAVLAFLRRSAPASLAAALCVAVWLAAFGGQLVPGKGGGNGDLRVVTHNVDADTKDVAGISRKLIASRADVLALEKIAENSAAEYRKALASAYPHHAVIGTVGIWSKYPLTETRPVNMVPYWVRAIRSVVHTPRGDLAVYAVHMPSVRVHADTGFDVDQRNAAVRRLGDALDADPARRIVVMGDFNGSTDDRALRPVTSRMTSAYASAGTGFGFTWPSAFPMVRIDQILVRGVTAVNAEVLPATASKHLPLAAELKLS